MKNLLLTLTFFSASMSFAGTAMNMEGTCKGVLDSKSSVNFTYYSNFDGCKTKSSAAVSFDAGNVGGVSLYTGERKFVGESDVYSFTTNNKEQIRLTFANLTGEYEGSMRYRNPETGKYHNIQLTCNIRNYEYAGCE